MVRGSLQEVGTDLGGVGSGFGAVRELDVRPCMRSGAPLNALLGEFGVL